jgi:hypothetical protein
MKNKKVAEKIVRPKSNPVKPAKAQAQRRPGREWVPETPVEEIEVAELNETDSAETTETWSREELENEFTAKASERIEINFRGSELLRARFPKPFEFAEIALTNWVQDGDFEELPVEHPLVQWAVRLGFVNAKALEKKIVANPAFEKALIQALTLGMKAQGAVAEFQKKFKSKSESED